MATRFTRSQTHAISAAPLVAPSASPRYNLLNAFGSNQQGPELIDQFQSFSARRTMPSASQPPPSQESPTPGACIVVIPDYNGSENLAGLLFGGLPSMTMMMPEIWTSPEAIPLIRPLMMTWTFQQKTSTLMTPMKNQRSSTSLRHSDPIGECHPKPCLFLPSPFLRPYPPH